MEINDLSKYHVGTYLLLHTNIWKCLNVNLPCPAVGRGGEGVSTVAVGGWRQGLYGLWVTPNRELLVLLLLRSDHFARVAFDPKHYSRVSDPDPDPQDPHVFGLPGSGSGSA